MKTFFGIIAIISALAGLLAVCGQDFAMATFFFVVAIALRQG